MSYDERKSVNRWRVSKEITLGDLLIAVTIGIPLVIAAVRLSDRVEDHERRITANETAINQHTSRLAQHDTEIAVAEARLAIENRPDPQPVTNPKK